MKRFLLSAVLLLAVGFVFAGEPLYFVQLTDTHFGQGDNDRRLSDAVEQINALPMDVRFAVFTGDILHDRMADSNTVNRFFQTLEKLEMPVYFVAGNHDLLKTSATGTLAVFTNRFGPLIQSVEVDGVEFVFVCTEPLAGGVQIEGYHPLAELDALLTEKAAGQPAVVCHHIPSVDDFWGGKMHDGWGRTEAGRQWVDLLNRHQVLAVIAGHFHRDEVHWLGDVPLFVGPPLSGWLGRQGAFRLYEVRDGKVESRTQYLR